MPFPADRLWLEFQSILTAVLPFEYSDGRGQSVHREAKLKLDRIEEIVKNIFSVSLQQQRK